MDNSNDKLVYLLCCKSTSGRAKHYIGVTSPENIYVRLRRHALGTGATVTTRWHYEQAPFTCTRIWSGSGYDVERALKRRGHYDRYCPACSGAQAQTLPALHGVSWLEPKLASITAVSGWIDAPRHQRSSTQQKGRSK